MRSQIALVGAGCLLLMAACGVDDGTWSPAPTPDPVVATAPSDLDPSTVTTPVAPPEPGAQGNPMLTCQVTSLAATPSMFEEHAQFEVAGQFDGQRVCFGEGEEGLEFCHFVEALELRYRETATCYKKAMDLLEEQGLEVYHGNAELWADAKRKLLPDIWGLDPVKTTEDVGHVSAWVHQMMVGGDDRAVEADPFCFAKRKFVSVRQAKQQIMNNLGLLAHLREGKVKWLLGSLRRGVNLEANGKRIMVTVRVVETPVLPPATPDQCVFRALP